MLQAPLRPDAGLVGTVYVGWTPNGGWDTQPGACVTVMDERGVGLTAGQGPTDSLCSSPHSDPHCMGPPIAPHSQWENKPIQKGTAEDTHKRGLSLSLSRKCTPTVVSEFIFQF